MQTKKIKILDMKKLVRDGIMFISRYFSNTIIPFKKEYKQKSPTINSEALLLTQWRDISN